MTRPKRTWAAGDHARSLSQTLKLQHRRHDHYTHKHLTMAVPFLSDILWQCQYLNYEAFNNRMTDEMEWIWKKPVVA
jgi:hypothetical protein